MQFYLISYNLYVLSNMDWILYFRLSIDITEESDAFEGSDDETSYPSFNISIG